MSVEKSKLAHPVAGESSCILALERVRFGFSRTEARDSDILRETSLCIGSNEIVSIVGESGSGKTTVLRLIAGELQPLAGTVTSPGGVSFLAQDDLLVPFRTVWENACLALELRDALSEERMQECRDFLKAVYLGAVADFSPSELSGGMRRRVAFVRQMLPSAKGILLDEPFSAQDGRTKQILEDILFERCRRSGAPCAVVTHDLDTAVAISDRVVMLSNGHISEIWQSAPHVASEIPSARRGSNTFGDMVAELSRFVWQEPHHE